MPHSENKFILKHTFDNVSNIKEDEYRYSEEEDHYNVPWEMYVSRKNGFLSFFLNCDRSSSVGKWSIEAEYDLKLVSENGKIDTKKATSTFGNTRGNSNSCGWKDFIKWEEMEKHFLVAEKLNVEAHVLIKRTTGLERKLLKHFDETMKQYSDIIVNVDNRKFYSSKLFLATQSSYFKTLLMEDPQENKKSKALLYEKPKFSQLLATKSNQCKAFFTGKPDQKTKLMKTKITLENIDPEDFQIFLEALYGESAIDDNTIGKILLLSEQYDAQTVLRRCEEFLIGKSNKRIEKKLNISLRYKLKNLKKYCLDNITTATAIRSAIPSDISKMDRSVMESLFQKALTLV